MGDSGARQTPSGHGNPTDGRTSRPQHLPSASARPTLRPPPPPRVISGGAVHPVANASANGSTPSGALSDAAGKKLRFYAIVAAGSFAVIVIAGLLVVIKNGQDRLARLETQIRSRDKIASEALEQTPSAPAPDAPPSSDSPITDASPVEPVHSPSGDAISAASEAPQLPDSAAKQATEPKFETTAAPTALAAWRLPESPASAAPVKTSWFAAADASASSQETSEPVCSADRSLHTALIWSKSPDEASALARREGKLVFLIHVSGNFEDPGFT